jgi:Holliday junction DNA helicase RuvB
MGRGPFKFKNFVGQKNLVKTLERLLNNAKKRDTVLPAVLFAGSTGFGKTKLVHELSSEYGMTTHLFTVTPKTSSVEIKDLLRNLSYFDFVLFDEIHNASKELQEFFYQVLDKWSYQDRNSPDNNEIISVPKFNFFAATDQPGRLLDAFHRRLTIHHFIPYQDEELKAIIVDYATTKKVSISPQAAKTLATISKSSPGEAIKIFDGLHMWADPESVQISDSTTRAYLEEMGVDLETGLNSADISYLEIITKMPQNKATLSHLKSFLKLDEQFLKRKIEPFLIQEGFIELNEKGRVLTQIGEQTINRLIKARTQKEELEDAPLTPEEIPTTLDISNLVN